MHVASMGSPANVISLYAKGMTTGDIQAHLAEIYDTEISRETISKITDGIVEDMQAWQNRPLDPLYPVVLIDAIVIKVRDAQVANRPVYVAIGVNLDGERDVLGLWLGPTGGEGAKQWVTHAHRAPQPWHRRRVDRVLRRAEGPARMRSGRRGPTRPCRPVSCTWSATVCVTRRRSTGRRSPEQMREIYNAPTVAGRRSRSSPSSPTQWRDTYPAMIRSWENGWDEFVPFLEFPIELRKIVYTTNAIESLNARFRRAVRHRGHFPNEQAAHQGPLPCRHADDGGTARTSPAGSTAGRQILNTLYHPLRRPDRSRHILMTTITPGYTKNLTDPGCWTGVVLTGTFGTLVTGAVSGTTATLACPAAAVATVGLMRAVWGAQDW